MGCNRGEAAPLTMSSSHGRSMNKDATCWRKSATVFSVGMRTRFKPSAISCLAQWPAALESSSLFCQHGVEHRIRVLPGAILFEVNYGAFKCLKWRECGGNCYMVARLHCYRG